MQREVGHEQRAARAETAAESRIERILETLAQKATRWVSGSHGFISAATAVLVWLTVGVVAGFSEKWHMALTAATAITTFLMVFLIQRSQTKDSLAIQLKLNEVIAALEGASNRMMAAEHLTEAELEELNALYRALRSRGQQRGQGESLSIEHVQGAAKEPETAEPQG